MDITPESTKNRLVCEAKLLRAEQDYKRANTLAKNNNKEAITNLPLFKQDFDNQLAAYRTALEKERIDMKSQLSTGI